MGSLPFQSDMGSGNNAILSSFEDIKRGLDIAYSYMIFEKPFGSGEGNEFKEIISILSRFENDVVECEVQRDKEGGNLMLMVKLDPKNAAKISEEFLNIRLPKDTTFYFYSSRSGK